MALVLSLILVLFAIFSFFKWLFKWVIARFDDSTRAVYGDSSSPSPPSTPSLSSSSPRTPSPPASTEPRPRPLPAPNQVVHALPMKVYTKSKGTARCQICLENYKKGDSVKKLPCLHEFHGDCLDRWLMDYNRSCPLCREDSCNPSSLPASIEEGYDADIDKSNPSSEEKAKDGESGYDADIDKSNPSSEEEAKDGDSPLNF